MDVCSELSCGIVINSDSDDDYDDDLNHKMSRKEEEKIEVCQLFFFLCDKLFTYTHRDCCIVSNSNIAML